MSVSAAEIVAPRRAAPVIERAIALFATRAAWWSVLGATCAVLLVPLFLVDVPPLLDYPNHMARMYVLAFGAQDPILSQMYEQHWAIIPNLAIDLVMPEMLKLLPIYLAGRVVLGVTLLLPLAGAIVYHRVAFGVRSYWPLTAALGAYNALFLFGFMNFLLALGMALLAAAGWLRWRETHPVWVTASGALATVSIFFMHLFGLIFLGVLIGCEEFSTFWRLRRTGGAVWSDLARRAAMGAVAFAPPVVLVLLAPLDQLNGRVFYRPLWHKLYCLIEPFMGYDGLADALTGGAFAVGLCLAVRQGRLRAAPGIALAFWGLFVAYLICPFAMKGTGFLDARFPIMLGLLLFAGLRPQGLSPRTAGAITAVLALVFLARTASIGVVWLEHNRELADFRRVTEAVAPGSRVLVVSVDPEDAPGYWDGVPRGRRIPAFFRLDFHLPALLTIERRAFIPYLFTVVAKQPLAVRPPFDRISVPEGQPPDWQSLVVGYNVHPVTAAPYLADWQHHFDDVLLLNAGGAGDLRQFLPGELSLVAASDVAALYHIRRD
jgi:hypothetical protein